MSLPKYRNALLPQQTERSQKKFLVLKLFFWQKPGVREGQETQGMTSLLSKARAAIPKNAAIPPPDV